MNAIITGGSRGIGAAAVRAFVAAGWRVAFLYARDEAAAQSVAAESGALAVRADVSERAQVLRAFAEIRGALGPVDALVNNAGIAQFRLFDQISEAEWDRMFAVHVKGAFFCAQAALQDMLPRKRGAIVNVASMWGEVGGSCEVHYSAAKAALIGMTRALAKELGPSGIRVNCVSPGAIDTQMNAGLDEAARRALCEETPLCRLGAPEEAAQAILFLAGQGASFITGQVLSPNGGIV